MHLWLLAASPALRAAPLASASALRRVASPVMQFRRGTNDGFGGAMTTAQGAPLSEGRAYGQEFDLRDAQGRRAARFAARGGRGFGRGGIYNDFGPRPIAYDTARPLGRGRRFDDRLPRPFGNDGYDLRGDFVYCAGTEASLYYLISDFVLRGLSLWIFWHSCGSAYGWTTFWIYLAGHSYVARTCIFDGFYAVLNALGSSIIGLFPLATGADPEYARKEAIYTTLFCLSIAFIGLYGPDLPHPIKDKALRTTGTALVTLAASLKVFACTQYVWPATYGEDFFINERDYY